MSIDPASQQETRADRFSDETARAKAERYGCDILYSTPRTLLLDIDSEDALERYYTALHMLADNGVYIVESDNIFISRSGKRHIVVTLKDRDYSLIERIMLQALLGSDINRELLTYIGSLHGQENPCLLFRPRNAPQDAEDFDEPLW